MHAYIERARTARTESRPLSAGLLASALVIVVASLLLLAAPVAWRAMQGIGEAHPTLAGCAAITDSVGRLACYDRLEKEAMRPPAKGANALFASH